MILRIAMIVMLLIPGAAWAEDRLVRLHAGSVLVDSGLLKHILPRFSLKTQVRVELVEDPALAEIVIGSDGRALFSGLGQTWHMQIAGDGKGAKRFGPPDCANLCDRHLRCRGHDATPARQHAG